MSLAEYLAKNYLTKEEPTSKKRKRKKDGSALRVDDTQTMGWEVVDNGDQEDVEDATVVENVTDTGNSKSFAAAENSNWEVVQQGDQDEQPDQSSAVTGLQTAEQVSRNLARQQEEEKRRLMKEDPSLIGRGAETIYRDATGRRVDVTLQRAEARRRLEAEEAKKRKDKELGMGVVQQRQKEERRRQLEEIRAAPFARTVDDVSMNEELKSQQRWNDPAASFLSENRDGNVSSKPTCKGAALPNRFGILPGYRWDGVDRSNGFEKRYFIKQNELKSREESAYGWSIEDM